MERLYTQTEVLQILLNLVNGIGQMQIGDFMPKRYKELVEVNGEKRWLTGKSIHDLLEAYLTLCIDAEAVAPILSPGLANMTPRTVLFGEYLEGFVDTYKNKQESLTKTNRKQIMAKHIMPKWETVPIGEIKPLELQKWFNELEDSGYSHETMLKIKNIMSPALDAAVEDGLVPRNPLKSKLLTIGGKETRSHKAIPAEKMKEIREAIPSIKEPILKNMLALLSYTGMRFEEVLGLRWEDIDYDGGWIMIQRAVVHPTRNQPEIKDPKTKTSKRRIPLPKNLESLLTPRYLTGFVVPSTLDKTRQKPMSYTMARKAYAKIQKRFDITEYTAHDFRDTCATEWREKGIPLDVISSLLGHAKVEVTQTRYVKYRDELLQGVKEIFDDGTGTKDGQNKEG